MDYRAFAPHPQVIETPLSCFDRPYPFHSTRHTFITWALEAGTPAKRVSEWVGATVDVIERHYAHAIPEVHKMDFLDGTRMEPNGTKRKDGVS